MTNFHLYLTQLWWQFFQIFVYAGIDPEKLYRATLKSEFRFVVINLFGLR